MRQDRRAGDRTAGEDEGRRKVAGAGDESSRAPKIGLVLYGRDYPAATVLSVLARAGYVTSERNADEFALDLIPHLRPAIVVLVLDGGQQAWQFLGRVARATACPLMVLLREAGQPEQARALEAGAGACLRDEDAGTLLGPQITALKRQQRVAANEQQIWHVRDLVIDLQRFHVLRDGRPVNLSPTELRMLACLAQSPGKPVSALDLLASVSPYPYTKQEAQELAKVYVRRLRKKLEHEGMEQPYVLNVRGAGYLLERRSRARPDELPTPAASGA